VDGFVQRALATGHVTRGGRRPGQGRVFYRPTVLAGALQTTRSSARSVRPGVSVTRFSDADQAIAWANDSDYGLAPACGPGRQEGHEGAGLAQYGCVW